MEKFKYLEHTADAKFQAFGSTLEEAFGNAALAMFNVMTDTEKVEKKKEIEISVDGHDLKSLLYNFLEELIILLDTEGFLLNSVSQVKIHNNSGRYQLKASVNGDAYSPKYKTQSDVKAVTYNDMEISEKPGNAMVQVVVDI